MKNNQKTKNRKMKREKGTLAITQIFILVIATIAISWMIGSEIGIVSGDVAPTCYLPCNSGDTCCADPEVQMTCTSQQNWGNALNCPNGCQNGACVTAQDQGTNNNNGILPYLKPIAGTIPTTYAGKKLNELSKNLFGPKISPAEKAGEMTGDAGSNLDIIGDYNRQNTGPGKGTTKGIGEYFHFSKAAESMVGQIVSNAVWAAVTYVVISYFAKKFASVRNFGDIQTAMQIGAGVGMAVVTVWAAIMAGESSGGPPGWIAAAVTALAFGVFMIVGYQVYSREVVTFRVSMWQPPEGGSECNKCNSLKIAGENACSEYICHSYGLACEWMNDETQYETCIEVNQGDKAPPIITPVKEIYGELVFPEKENDKYDYTISSAGAKIIFSGDGGGTGKCVPAFTPIKLAFKTNEKANCKISLEEINAEGASAEEKFDLMMDMGEGSAYTDNHTLQLPSSVAASQSALEAAGYQLTNGGKYIFYIKCKDVRGNINSNYYIMSFCVQSGPDTRPPEITGTRPEEGSFIAYGVNSIENFQVYTDEPADCRWDPQPKRYEYMSHNFDKCSQNLNDPLTGFEFGCEGTLTDFKNGVENKYYIACIDQPELKGTAKENQRNDMYPPEDIILKGTKQLVVQEVAINGEENNSVLRDSTENINVQLEVKTFGGAEEGKARCKYSPDLTLPRTYSLFDNNNNRDYITVNVQNLYLSEGNYKFFVQCFDIAGNTAETMVNFSVETDTSSPNVVRVYKDDDYLKLVTDEEAECAYSNFGCIYDMDADGEFMGSTDGINHLTDWNIENDFYIKCRDMYGNEPAPDTCSLIARPFEILQQAS
jgi:hypothetical protein